MRILHRTFTRALAAATLLALSGLALAAGAARAPATATLSPPLPGFSDKFIHVNGVRLHYRVGGWGNSRGPAARYCTGICAARRLNRQYLFCGDSV